MKKILCLTLILIMCLSSCKKEKHCEVNNPLTQLPWLKEIKKHGYRFSKGFGMEIYQCTYNNGIDGFYVNPCILCHVYTAALFSCDGTVLADDIEDSRAFKKEWNLQDMKLIYTNIK
jgi:hypothetical protein